MEKKVLVCYGTRYGSTAEVAQEIGKTIQELGCQVDVVDLKESKSRPQPKGYDLVVVGSGIQAGRWTKEPLDFMTRNKDMLAKTRVALFVVCANAGSPDTCQVAQTEYLDKIAASYPSISFVSTGSFGGVFDFKKYSRPVRALVKSIVKKQMSGGEVPEKIDMRDWDKVRTWASELISISSS
jgi:menaquinone-dependent protoporphyrinogen oxidase